MPRASRPRPEIELAWRRAALAGLDPGQEVSGSVLSDVDRRSRLAIAAEPVLDRMARDLADTRFSVLLADATSVIVDRRIGQRSLSAALERVMAVPGSRYTESVSGTNAFATAFELRQGISVIGTEHYLEALQQFSCYGAPVIHPAARPVDRCAGDRRAGAGGTASPVPGAPGRPGCWLAEVTGLLDAGSPVVIDDAHQLRPRDAERLIRLVDRRRGPVILVSAALDRPDETRRLLLARCIDRRETTPLRQRREEFTEIVRDLIQDIPGAQGRRLTATALHILEGHDWPGNVRELAEVLAYAAGRPGGDITEADLPPAYRVSPRRRHLSPLEQAEHDTIVRALAAEGGNKARTAARLGIGRNTLYQRIRQLGIPT